MIFSQDFPAERVVIAKPQLVDGAILGDMHPRIEAPSDYMISIPGMYVLLCMC